jgi:hypothetical protein
LAPRFRQSRIISEFSVSIEADASGYLIIAGWPTLDWVRYHQDGFEVHTKDGETREIPPRLVAGIRPSMRVREQEMLDEFCSQIVAG